MKADIACRVTAAAGWYVPSLKPVEMPLSRIHVIALQNGLSVGTSLKGSSEHAGRAAAPDAPSARRAMNADMACRVTGFAGRPRALQL